MKTRIRTTFFLLVGAMFLLAYQNNPPASLSWPVPETFVQNYGPFDLREDQLQQVPPMGRLKLPEDAWLVGYKVEVFDKEGQALPRDLVCHTFLGDRIPMPTDPHHQALKGTYSDGFTAEINFHEGFGIPYKAGQELIWMPMFNNRGMSPVSAVARVTYRLIWDKNLPQPLQKLNATMHSVEFPALYYVSPGKDVRETKFHLRFKGKIHMMGTHIHPYGVSMELMNLTRNETVWKAEGRVDSEGDLVSMPVYQNLKGYAVEPNDQFKLVATYHNTTDEDIDAMAGLYIFYNAE